MMVKMLVLLAATSVISTATLAAPVAPGNMKAVCRGEASAQFGARPIYMKVGKLKRLKDGSYAIKGMADLGTNGNKPFQCNFDKNGEMQPLMSLVDEGKL